MKVKSKKSLFIARAELGLTIKELSVKANVPTATISRVENGGTLSVRSAKKLCVALNKSFDTLFYVVKEWFIYGEERNY